MPATYQGNPSNNSSATPWVGGSGHSLGDLIAPSTPDGQVFLCVQAGTSGSVEPGWSTPPYPTLGTTFTDNTVIWSTFGTQPGPWAPIIQTPVDSDPPLAFGQVIPNQTISDQLGWISVNAGILGDNNVWTGTNTFNAFVAFNGGSQTLPASQWGSGVPTNRYLGLQMQVNSGFYTHIYADALSGGLAFVTNASWNGTNWAYDDSSVPASKFIFTNNGIAFEFYPASSSSPWVEGSWQDVFLLDYPTLALSVGLSLTIAGVTTINNSLQVNGTGTFTGALQAAQVANLNGVGSSGQYGCGLVVNSTGDTSGGSGSAPIALSVLTPLLGTGSGYFAGGAGWYRVTIYATSASTGDTSSPPNITINWAHGTANAGAKTITMLDQEVNIISGLPFYSYTTIIYNSLAGGIGCVVDALPGTGPYHGWAVLEAIF